MSCLQIQKFLNVCSLNKWNVSNVTIHLTDLSTCFLSIVSDSSDDDDGTSTVDNSLPFSIAPLQDPVDFIQQPHSKYTLSICNDPDDEEEEEEFPTVS